MDNFIELLYLLDEYYTTICSDIIECDAEETINFLNEYWSDEVIFKINPIYYNEIDEDDENEYENEDEEKELDEDEEEPYFIEYEDMEDLINQINDYDEDQLFEIEIPDELMDIYIPYEFRNLIFSSEFNNNQREDILKILMNASIKYSRDKKIIDIYGEKYVSFCKNCNYEEFIKKYVKDNEFCIYVTDIYEIMFADVVTKKQDKIIKDENCSVKTINDIIRETLINMYNYNINNLGYTKDDSAAILCSYLMSKKNNNVFNKIYSEILNGKNIENIFDKNYACLVIITDYLRLKSLNIKNEFNIINNYDDFFNEITNLVFLMTNDDKNIIERFNTDPNFIYDMVLAFIDFNINLDEKTKKNCVDTDLIKKINPLYILDLK